MMHIKLMVQYLYVLANNDFKIHLRSEVVPQPGFQPLNTFVGQKAPSLISNPEHPHLDR